MRRRRPLYRDLDSVLDYMAVGMVLAVVFALIVLLGRWF